jgi:hypothetical protein
MISLVAAAWSHRSSSHPEGKCRQLLGRGLLPRLSIGTLQLSIRCSSIHFLPERSFPVSNGPLAGTAVSALGAAWSGCLSCAKVDDARHIAKRKLINARWIGSIDFPPKSSASD